MNNRMNVEEMQRQLRTLGYYTDSVNLLAQVALRLHDMQLMRSGLVAMLLDGPPGTGKTFLAKTIQKLLDAEMFSIQFTVGVGREVMMHDIDIAAVVNAQVQNASKKGVEVKPEDLIIPGILQRALTESHKGRVVLLLDEIDKAKPYVDAMLLEFLQDGAIEDPVERGKVITGNPANLIVFLTKNNERSITEPLIRRCQGSVYMGWPKPDTELQIVRKGALEALKGWEIRGNVEGMAKAIITFANKVRKSEATLRKVPSSPEVVQAVVDALRVDKEYRGIVVARQLFKYYEDYKAYFEAKGKDGDDAVTEEKLRALLAEFG